MTERRRNPFEKDQLRREAADWFVLMRSPDAEKHRADFERWIARGALHRVAYNRIADLYSAGKRVNWDKLPPPRPVRGTAKRAWMVTMGIVAIVGFIFWRSLAAPAIYSPSAQVVAQRGDDAGQFSTRLGEIRKVSLPDGSAMIVDTDTLVSMNFSHSERHLRLEHGRARFEVAHEQRPFVVDAGDTEVIARGTIFDVAYRENRTVDVRLLSGAVDVKLKRPSVSTRQIRLHPGQGIRLSAEAPVQFLPEANARDIFTWPSGMVEFRRKPLADVIAEANRYASTKISLSDPRLGSIPVSGVFRIDDPEKLARRLAQLLGLRVKRTAGQIILSRPTE